jgi:hypothetical protein
MLKEKVVDHIDYGIDLEHVKRSKLVVKWLKACRWVRLMLGYAYGICKLCKPAVLSIYQKLTSYRKNGKALKSKYSGWTVFQFFSKIFY